MSAAAVKELQTARLALIGSARAGRRTLLDMLLSAKGYEIAVCEDGPSVLEFLKENQPAIAIFDHDLPGMDGREICSRMRFITRLAETPIAIVTPPVEEMGGVVEFEGFSDSTTADIVEAEPLGKKSLVERLETVIRDQKGAANAGKVTIAIPTMVPPIPDIDPAGSVAANNDLDVFVDDDVDIEVDVARAIYSNDDSHDHAEVEQHTDPAPVATVGAVSAENSDEHVDARAEYGEEGLLHNSPDEAAQQDLPQEADQTAAAQESAVQESTVEEFDFFTDSDESHGDRKDESPAGKDDIEWPEAIEAIEPDAAEVTEPDESDVAGPDAAEAAEPEQSEKSLEASDELTEREPREAAAAEVSESSDPEPDEERELELVGTSGDTSATAEAAADAGTNHSRTVAEVAADAVSPESVEAVEPAGEEHQYSGEAEKLAAEDQPAPSPHEADTTAEPPDTEPAHTEPAHTGPVNAESVNDAPVDAESAHAAPQTDQLEVEPASASEELGDEDINATIEAAIEAVNLAAMEEAQYQTAETEFPAETEVRSETAPEVEAEPSQRQATRSDDELAQTTESEAIDVKSTVEMIVESADGVEPEDARAAETHKETTATEPFVASANNYANGSADKQIDLTVEEADDQEEGDPAVLNEERSNMQALIDEQAERIENLQQRNVVLRQELEQRRADDALRHEERSKLQALIKEQTEAITNLQQRNVQLRQELDQYKAEEAKRESERNFLQSHTSEQAETIAKLQQLNALLRQELEQRKADEAPLRDFLQRLLDRDEKSAYQEAVRNEIISLGRDNS